MYVGGGVLQIVLSVDQQQVSAGLVEDSLGERR